MSCYKIFYDKETKCKMMQVVKDRDEYLQLRDSSAQKAMVRQVRNGNGNAKMRLLQMNYSCLPTTNDDDALQPVLSQSKGYDNDDLHPGCGRLKGCSTPSNSVGMDVDLHRDDFTNEEDYQKALAEIPEKVLAKKDELGLLMLERSATKGYHLVFKRKAELSQEDNLRWASDLLGVEFDKGAKDITRVFFTTTASEDDLLFLDDELFINEAMEKTRLEGDTSEAVSNPVHTERSGGCAGIANTQPNMCLEGTTSEVGEQGTALQAEVSGSGVNPAASPSSMQPVTDREQARCSALQAPSDCNGTHTPSPGTCAELCRSTGEGERSGGEGLFYHDIPYSTIIAKYWELFNEGKEPQEGDRNVKTYELAMTIRHICDYDQQKMEQIIPRYDGFDMAEWRQTIKNAVNEPRKSTPYRLKQLLKAVKDERKMALIAPSDSPKGEKGVPERPKRMPELLKLLSSKVPMKLKAMVEEAVWPAMCAHLKGVTFRYIDGVIHEANISSPLIGRQSSGKGAVNQPIECLLADITARDRENESRLLDWRRRNQGKGASKDKQPRPEDIVIQRLDDDLTPAALSQALIDAETNGGKRVITKVDEIELLNRIGNGKNDTVGVLVRYGWDSARWGQRRVGLDSVSGSYTVRWVWNASCTLKSARKFITNTWIADGSLSRLNVNALLLPKDDHEMPKIGEYDEKFQNDLKLYVDRLNAASGLIECPQANRLAEEMKQEHDRIADLCESEGYRTFSYRAVVIGWLKAMMLYIANGYKWDKTMAEYVRYSVRRDMYLKMYFFGQQIEEEFEEEERQQQHGPQNLLSTLPEEFTMEDYLRMRQAQGKRGDGKSTLRTWKTRGYIDYDEVTETYVKR